MLLSNFAIQLHLPKYSIFRDTKKSILFMDPSQEKYVFEAFKKLYQEFPPGEIIQDDKPDFIINSENKKIGVELTQIFIDTHIATGLNERRRESLRVMLGDCLCNELEDIVPFKFILSIDFSREGFSTKDIPRIVSACKNYLNQQTFKLNDYESIDFENWGQLPVEIDQISLFCCSILDKPSFSESGGGVIPDLTEQPLQVILDKKERALKQYKHCDEYWLLIEEGTFYSDSFDEITIDNIETSFARIFLYRHSRGQIIQLK